MSHTSTPWSLHPEDKGLVCDAQAETIAIVLMVNRPMLHNAAYIVKCVNAHDRLIKALEYCAYGPGELRADNQAQYLVARAALESLK